MPLVFYQGEDTDKPGQITCVINTPVPDGNQKWTYLHSHELPSSIDACMVHQDAVEVRPKVNAQFDSNHNVKLSEEDIQQNIDGKATLKANNQDEVVLVGLPIPCQVVINEAVMEVADGELVLSTDQVATFVIEVDTWPYMKAKYIVEASK